MAVHENTRWSLCSYGVPVCLYACVRVCAHVCDAYVCACRMCDHACMRALHCSAWHSSSMSVQPLLQPHLATYKRCTHACRCLQCCGEGRPVNVASEAEPTCMHACTNTWTMRTHASAYLLQPLLRRAGSRRHGGARLGRGRGRRGCGGGRLQRSRLHACSIMQHAKHHHAFCVVRR